MDNLDSLHTLNEGQRKQIISVLQIIHKNQEAFKTGILAQHLQLPPSTTTELIQKIADLGLVQYEKYYPVRLTTKGRSIAEQLVQAHRILEVFFVNQLQLDLTSACEQATKIEVVADPMLIIRLCSWLNHPKECPHGLPIDDPCRHL